EAHRPGGQAARDRAQPPQDLAPHAQQAFPPARVGDPDAQGAALERDHLRAAGQLGPHRPRPGRAQEEEPPLRGRREELLRDVAVGRAFHGHQTTLTLYCRLGFMQCPRCRTDIDGWPAPGRSIGCPGCGAPLMPRPPARVGEDTLRTTRPPPPPPVLDTPVAGTPAISWPPADEPPPKTETPLEQVLAELKAIREAQAEVLALLRARPSGVAKGEPDGAGAMEPAFLAPARPRVRTRQRKSLLLIDDDPATREAAVAELEQAQVPARA